MIDLSFSDLVGKRFCYGGRGPDLYDCWGLVMEIHRRLGVELPDYKNPTDVKGVVQLMSQEIYLWKECEQKPGATMYMRVGRDPHHVGFYLGKNRFIHAHEGAGVVCIERLDRWQRNIVGYYQYNPKN